MLTPCRRPPRPKRLDSPCRCRLRRRSCHRRRFSWRRRAGRWLCLRARVPAYLPAAAQAPPPACSPRPRHILSPLRLPITSLHRRTLVRNPFVLCLCCSYPTVACNCAAGQPQVGLAHSWAEHLPIRRQNVESAELTSAPALKLDFADINLHFWENETVTTLVCQNVCIPKYIVASMPALLSPDYTRLWTVVIRCPFGASVLQGRRLPRSCHPKWGSPSQQCRPSPVSGSFPPPPPPTEVFLPACTRYGSEWLTCSCLSRLHVKVNSKDTW